MLFRVVLITLVFVTTVLCVSTPLKIWNNARIEAWACKHSGCHCTHRLKGCPGISAASNNPSGA